MILRYFRVFFPDRLAGRAGFGPVLSLLLAELHLWLTVESSSLGMAAILGRKISCHTCKFDIRCPEKPQNRRPDPVFPRVSGAATYGSVETGVGVAVGGFYNFLLVNGAYETGVGIGSAINATFGFSDYCPCEK